MAGDSDPICSLAATRILSDGLPNATTEIFAGASHFFLIEQPQKFNALLLAWLQRHAAASPSSTERPEMSNTPSSGGASAGEELQLHVGDEVVTARVLGQGRPIVLLHSLLADRTSFGPLAALLARTHRVIMLDLPGFGGSHPVTGGLEAVADRCAEAIRALGLAQKPVVLGNGYGGFVALLTAIRHPQLAERLVLADCGAAFSEPGRQAFRNMSAAATAKGLAAISEVAMRRLFSPEFQAANPALVEQRRERFIAVHPETFHAACAALAALDLRPQVPGVKLPVLVLVGEHDEATPPPMSRELAQLLPDARFELLPGCAHVPQLQQPQQFLAAIESFVRG
jgi:3-oxoadipate enol-lactonase